VGRNFNGRIYIGLIGTGFKWKIGVGREKIGVRGKIKNFLRNRWDKMRILKLGKGKI